MSKPKLKLKRNDKLYWSTNKSNSYGLPFRMIMNIRSTGKTTNCTLEALTKFINGEERFVYIRRYKNEQKKSPHLLDPIIDNVEAVGDGMGGGTWYYVEKVFDKQLNKHVKVKKIIGFYVTLSVASMYKSVNFGHVTTIIFDEFTLSRNGLIRYLPNEVHDFFELINTITRLRNDYVVYLLGNKVDLINPYFEYFNIPKFDNIYIDRKRGLYIEKDIVTKGMKEAKYETNLAKLTRGTAYDDYNTGDSALIVKKISKANKLPNDKLIYRFKYNGYTLNIYVRNVVAYYIEAKQKDIDDSFTIDIGSFTFINYSNIRTFKKTTHSKLLVDSFYNDECYYNDDIAYTLLSEIVDYIE